MLSADQGARDQEKAHQEERVSERRRSGPRFIRHFMVRYRRLDEPSWHISPLKDFSRDGARLVCEGSFEPGDSLELWLGRPVFLEPVRMIVRVIWKKPVFSGSLQMTECGISFTRLDENLRRMIDETVERFLKHP